MRKLKFLIKACLGLLVGLLCLWATFLGLLQTDIGQKWTLNQLKGYFERLTEMRIEVKEVHLSFPLNLDLQGIKLFENDNTPIVAIEHLHIACAYTYLLNGRIVFSNLQGEGIEILHLPAQFQLTSSKGNSETPWDAPIFPFYVKIANMSFQNILVKDETLIHKQEFIKYFLSSPFDLQGMISNNPFKKAMTAHLQIKTTKNEPQLPSWHLSVDAQNHLLSLSCHANNLPLHLFHERLPRGINGTLALFASGMTEDWQNLTRENSRTENQLGGHFKFSFIAAAGDETFLGKPIVVRSQYRINGKEVIELVDFKAESPHFFLDGNFFYHALSKNLQASLKGQWKNLADLRSLLGYELAGSLSFATEVEGSLPWPKLRMEISSPHLLFLTESFDNVNMTIRAGYDNHIQGDIDLSLVHKNNPWQLTTAFASKDLQSIDFSDLCVDAPHTSGKGSVVCTLPDGHWEGQLQAEIRRLEDLTPFMPTSVQGEGTLAIKLSQVFNAQQQKQQRLEGVWKGNRLRWKDWKAELLRLRFSIDIPQVVNSAPCIRTHLDAQDMDIQGYSIAHCTLTGEGALDSNLQQLETFVGDWKAEGIEWEEHAVGLAEGSLALQQPMESMKGSLRFALANVNTTSFHFSSLNGATSFSNEGHAQPFQLEGRAGWKEDLIFKADGLWNIEREELSVTIQNLLGSLGAYPLELQKPLQFKKLANAWQVDDLSIQLGEGHLQGSFYQTNQEIDVQFKTNEVPSEYLSMIFPELPLNGQATFQGRLTGNLINPTGQFQVSLHDVQINEDLFAQKPYISGEMMMAMDAQGIRLNSELNGVGRTPMKLSGSIPITFSLQPIKLNHHETHPLDLILKAEGELGSYLQLLFHDATNLSGHAKIALAVSGHLLSPKISGHLDLSEGTYESTNTGTLYHKIQGHMEGDGSKIVLTQFSALDNKNGSLEATGVIHVEPSKNFPFEFENPPLPYLHCRFRLCGNISQRAPHPSWQR